MSSKLNVETFVAVLKKSGLVEPDRLQKLVGDFTARGGAADDSPKLADFLVSNGVVTRWQAEQLLRGKHKGYFLGKYRLLSLLGKGGMSSVYLAEHVLMRRRCALKVLPHKRVNDSSYLARFHREAQAVALLDHPNIVRAYDVDHQLDRDNEIHFLVMEYVEGFSLQELIQKQGVCSFCDAAEYIRQAALGLHNAHEAGMVHRDVKPGNLLVDPNGVVKVLDLGLARFFTGDEGEDALTIRHDEKVLGTADYLAPEQALDSHTVDARADIYSLGCTMYFILSGRPPFTEGTLAQRLMSHQSKTPPTIESLRKDIPLSLAAIVRKMMSKKPEERYGTAKEVAEVLYAWIDANANPEWRRNHSNIFGARNDQGGDRAKLLVAQPVVALPVATPVAASPGTPLPTGAQSGSLANVDQELTNFFQSLSDSQKSTGLRPAPPKQDSAPKLSPAPSNPTMLAATAPPHLKPGSSRKLTVAPPSPPADPVFPDFGATPNVISKPGSSKRTPSISTSMNVPKRGKPLSMPVLAGICGGAVLVLVVVAYFMGWIGENSTAPQRPIAALPPWPADKREITVGESGDYKTIVDALKAVRRRYEPTGALNDQMVVRIAAGTYKEHISIDGTIRRPSRQEKKTEPPGEPDWPQGIKLVADGEVILQPQSDVPAIRLKNIFKFIIEGVTIDASGKAVGIELVGDLNDTRVSGLTIEGFSQAGIVCSGAKGLSFGNSQLVLEKLTLKPASASAVGIQMKRTEEGGDPSDTVIRNCRFNGAMAAGLTVSGTGPYRISILENLFLKSQDAIRLEGTAQWKDLSVNNNTFYDCRNGIVFTQMPPDGALGLSVRRNLFAKTSGAEVIVQSGYNPGQLAGIVASEFNYSDRDKPATPTSGEVEFLFDANGKRGEKGITFASTDATNPKYLAPAENSVQRNVPGGEGEKPWVGAKGP